MAKSSTWLHKSMQITRFPAHAFIVSLAATTLSGCGFLPAGQANSGDQKPATVTATVTAEAAKGKKPADKDQKSADSDATDSKEPEPKVVTVTKEPVPTVTVIERAPAKGGGGGGYVYGPNRMCESGLGVNSTTSCPFARNVWQATSVSRDTSSTSAYSPVTGKWYNLRCSSNQQWLICRGGVNAEVFMRL